MCYPLSVFSDKCWNSCFCIWILNSLQRGNLFTMEGKRFAFAGQSCPSISLLLFPEGGVMYLNLTWLPGKQRLWGKGQLELCLHRDAYEDLSPWFSSPAMPASCKIVLSKYVLEENVWIQAHESISSNPMLAFSPSAADTLRNGIMTSGTYAIASELGANPGYL